MGKIDYAQLADDLDEAGDGPTVAEVARLSRQDARIVQLLELLARPQVAPSVNVAPNVVVPEPTVTVQLVPAKAKGWDFEFVRNADGTVQRVIARELQG